MTPKQILRKKAAEAAKAREVAAAAVVAVAAAEAELAAMEAEVAAAEEAAATKTVVAVVVGPADVVCIMIRYPQKDLRQARGQ